LYDWRHYVSLLQRKPGALRNGAPFIAASLMGLISHGMASAWPELLGIARLKSLDHEALVHQLIKAERTYREVRSMAYQMLAARLPHHRDVTAFAFDQAQVDEALVRQLHELKFFDSAHNVVFVGGRAAARHTWPPAWASMPSARMANGCDSSPQWS
jgi:hypothetical protein